MLFRRVSRGTDPSAGKPADPKHLVNVPRLVAAYFTGNPDPFESSQRSRSERPAIAGRPSPFLQRSPHPRRDAGDLRATGRSGATGPLFLGMDTHALSEPAFRSALEVLAGNGVEVRVDRNGGYTPTPAISHAILSHNRGRKEGLADGIVITPSHNPPEDGGSSTTRRTAGRRTRGSPGRSRSARTGSFGRGPGRCGGSLRAGPCGRHDPTTRLRWLLRR